MQNSIDWRFYCMRNLIFVVHPKKHLSIKVSLGNSLGDNLPPPFPWEASIHDNWESFDWLSFLYYCVCLAAERATQYRHKKGHNKKLFVVAIFCQIFGLFPGGHCCQIYCLEGHLCQSYFQLWDQTCSVNEKKSSHWHFMQQQLCWPRSESCQHEESFIKTWI